jgi:Lrp/AsnC family transcriptional regulator, leucine-responsive regulatory protein
VPTRFDSIDRRILEALQTDGRIQNVELAKKVGLSPSPCLRRVRLLEESGVIKGYVATIDAAKVGYGLTLFARVWLSGQDATTISDFVAAIVELPQVVECYLMAGECDALLRVVASDLNGYYRFQADHLSRIKGVQSVKTDVPMQAVKIGSAVPIQLS